MNRKDQLMQIKAIILVLISIGVAGLSYSDETARDRDDDRPRIIVPRDVATIQEAVDTIPDGGRVVVHEGRYEEIITISGKTVHLIGKGRPQLVGPIPDRFVNATESEGIINYVEGGGGSIKGFNFIGSDAAIKGFDRSSPPGELVVEKSTFQSSGRAILWGYSESRLTVKSVAITGTLWHGISTNSSPALTIQNSSINTSALGVGLFIQNTGFFTPAKIKSTSFAFNERGGILADNSALLVDDCFFYVNAVGSIRLVGSIMTGKNNYILGTAPDNVTGFFGDGIIALPKTVSSEVRLEDSVIEDSARSGILNSGSIVALKNVLTRCSAFDFNGEPADKDEFGPGLPPQDINFTFVDEGGNFCGCPDADFQCVAVSSQLQLPPYLGGAQN